VKYKQVKVTERHVAYVWVEAESDELAIQLALEDYESEYECVEDAEVIAECDEADNETL